MADELPSTDRMVLLANEYFSSIHSLRCYAFIHPRCFLRDLERQSRDHHQGNALLHVVCAIGAK
jgi:hypothetical protein